MKGFILQIATLFFTTFLIAMSSHACECVPVSVQESIKYSAVIFDGIVISKERIQATYPVLGRKQEMSIVKYRVVVNEVYKGLASKDTLTILTGSGGGDCGIYLAEGKEYIIYGLNQYPGKPVLLEKQNGQVYWTHICTRTQLVNEAELKELQRYL